jgi:hypothetical protein
VNCNCAAKMAFRVHGLLQALCATDFMCIVVSSRRAGASLHPIHHDSVITWPQGPASAFVNVSAPFCGPVSMSIVYGKSARYVATQVTHG